ncbi:MAG: hypothetical protein HBSAPP03_13300 [Phycisphaerae bacterium]|nr:MAG: hypothetical protein HBSAPP03_13300 [Phycisphaerae bacterium]
MLDADTLRAARPDIILTQDVCHVCSIDLATVRRVAMGMSPEPVVVSLNPSSLEDVLDDILRVGRAIGHVDRAGVAVVGLRERLARAQEHVNAYEEGPSVAMLEWTDPLFCAGHWSARLIELAGGRHLLNPSVGHPPSPPGPSRAISPEELIAAEPEFLIVCPCGAGLETTRAWAQALRAHSWWRDLPAVRRGRVALLDGNQMFNRPGPRLVDAFEFLVGWLHGAPGLVPPGFPWELLR